MPIHKPAVVNEFDSPEVRTARQYLGETLARSFQELRDGNFHDCQEKTGTDSEETPTVFDIVEFMSTVSFLDLERCDTHESYNGKVVFEIEVSSGEYFQLTVSTEGRREDKGDKPDIVFREVEIVQKFLGQTQEIPDTTLIVSNIDNTTLEQRYCSLLTYVERSVPKGGSLKDMDLRKAELYNNTLVNYNQPADKERKEVAEAQEAYKEILVIYEGAEIPPVGTGGGLEEDYPLSELYRKLLDEVPYDTGKMHLGLPDISQTALANLETGLRALAIGGEGLDIGMHVITSKDQLDGEVTPETRWVGYSDAENVVHLYIYTKEFYESNPKASELIEQEAQADYDIHHLT